MANLRIIHDNAIDRALTLTASTTAGSLAASNLQTDIKTEVWRATGTSATLTATWTNAEVVGAVVLPFCNLTSSATLRVRGYTNVADSSPVIDTGTVYACQYAPFGLWDWGMLPLAPNGYQPNAYTLGGANDYAYGAGAYGRAYFASHQVIKKIVIDIVDTSNPMGYVECSRLVVGAYWEPAQNAAYGAKVGMQDSSSRERNEAGDLITTRKSRSRQLTFDIADMAPNDRTRLWYLLRDASTVSPVFVSLLPEATNPLDEQINQIYGKLSQSGAISFAAFDLYTTSVTLEEV